MPGTLYVVATPIGNLEDISHRAVRILGSVPLIAAEDTRRTRKLLAHYGIVTPLVSFHAHSLPGRTAELLTRLSSGTDIALVSDAGMPTISDPGVELVAAARASGALIDVIPGPSALTTALAAAGFSGGRTIFMGFAPRKKAERRAAISSACQPGCIVVFFESPHRISNLLTDIYNELGDRPICVARELTKLHQEVIVGRTKQVTETDFRRQGEFTVVIGPQLEGGTPREVPGPLALSQEFYHLTNIMRLARRAAVSRLAHKYETTSREMYTMVERALDFGN